MTRLWADISVGTHLYNEQFASSERQLLDAAYVQFRTLLVAGVPFEPLELGFVGLRELLAEQPAEAVRVL